MTDADRLLIALNCAHPAGRDQRHGASAAPDASVSDSADQQSPSQEMRQHIQTLRDKLQSEPEATIAAAPCTLGREPSVKEFEKMLDQAEAALEAPARHLAALDGGPSYQLPPEEQFPGYAPAEIEIDPTITKFQTSDWGAWALTGAQAAIFKLRHDKLDLPAFDNTSFRYPLISSDGVSRLALFSDWGSGYYHSQYIAKHIGTLAPHAAIHLGDVYYTGRQFEVDDYLAKILGRYVTDSIPFFALNANHEMDSQGIPYFKYLDQKRNDKPELHQQETSFFTLFDDRFQITAIDTAYHGNGRFKDTAMLDWLAAQLEEGRANARVNILLSQSEPFDKDSGTVRKLLGDLSSVKHMIDLWFWGDQHYAAMYEPNPPDVPFFGACIGHGGYPYEAITDLGQFRTSVAPLLYAETGIRFSARPDRGANGFVMLNLDQDAIDIQFIDWRERDRGLVRLSHVDGRIQPNPVSARLPQSP